MEILPTRNQRTARAREMLPPLRRRFSQQALEIRFGPGGRGALKHWL